MSEPTNEELAQWEALPSRNREPQQVIRDQRAYLERLKNNQDLLVEPFDYYDEVHQDEVCAMRTIALRAPLPRPARVRKPFSWVGVFWRVWWPILIILVILWVFL